MYHAAPPPPSAADMEPVQPAATAPAPAPAPTVPPLPPPEEEVKQGTEETTAPVAAISEARARGEQQGAVETETGAASMMEEGREEREGEHEEEGRDAYHVLHTVLNLIEHMKKKIIILILKNVPFSGKRSSVAPCYKRYENL